MQNKKMDKYLLALFIFASIYAVLWTLYAHHLYTTFDAGFWDLGDSSYSFYLHIFHPALTGGLQYFVFMNHLSIFALLLLPIIYIFRSPISLIAVQNIFLAATSLIIFKIGKDITKRSPVGFLFGILFLLNPGVWGISTFYFHLEAFIPFFCILSFYFYLKGSRIGFIAFYLLMLATIETATFVGVVFLIGLLYYEIIYKRRKLDKSSSSKNIKTIIICLGISILFYLLYHFATASLLNLYTTNPYYASMPQIERLLNYLPLQANALNNAFKLNPYVISIYLSGIIGITVLFLGFGLSSLSDPLLTAILISPWLGEVYLLHNPYFLLFNNEYYAYAIGGSAVAALLGLKLLYDKKISPHHPFNRIITEKNLQARMYLSLSIGIFVVLFLLIFVYSSIATQPHYQISASSYKSMSKVLGSIPKNSSVMSQYLISPQLYYVANLELTPGSAVYGFTTHSAVLNLSLYSFKPQYIVIDPRLSDFAYTSDANVSIYGYMGNNYTLINSTNGLQVYKQVNLTG